MEARKPLTREEMINLGIAIAKSDIRFSEKLSQIASSLGLELPQDKIITPAMPHYVLEGYNQIMNKKLVSNGEKYLANQNKNYSN